MCCVCVVVCVWWCVCGGVWLCFDSLFLNLGDSEPYFSYWDCFNSIITFNSDDICCAIVFKNSYYW